MQSLFSELPHSATHADTFERGGEREREQRTERVREPEREVSAREQ